MHDVVGIAADLRYGVFGLWPFSSADVGDNPGVLGVVNDVLDPNLSEGGKAFWYALKILKKLRFVVVESASDRSSAGVSGPGD